jgi:hypothetical protein
MSQTLQQRVIRALGALGIGVAAIYAGQRPVYAQPAGRPQHNGPQVMIIAPPAGGPQLSEDFIANPVVGCSGYLAAWYNKRADHLLTMQPVVANLQVLQGHIDDFRNAADQQRNDSVIDQDSANAFLAGTIVGMNVYQNATLQYPQMLDLTRESVAAESKAYFADPMTTFCSQVDNAAAQGANVLVRPPFVSRQKPSLRT